LSENGFQNTLDLLSKDFRFSINVFAFKSLRNTAFKDLAHKNYQWLCNFAMPKDHHVVNSKVLKQKISNFRIDQFCILFKQLSETFYRTVYQKESRKVLSKNAFLSLYVFSSGCL